MAEELKACPFCGGEPNLTHSDYVHDDLRPMPVVECKSCSAWVRAEDWNTRAQLPSQGGEAVEVVAWRVSHPDTVWKVYEKNPESWAAGDFEIQTLMTVAQHQRILAASAGSADHVGVVFTMEALAPGGGVKSHASLNRDLPAGTKLYTHPADQVAEGVVVSRELLEQATNFGRPDLMEIALGQLTALMANSEGVKT